MKRLLVVAAVLIGLACCVRSGGKVPEGFMFGAHTRSYDPYGLEMTVKMGAKYTRTYNSWSWLVPHYDSVDMSMSVEKVKANLHLIDEFAATANWKVPDQCIALVKQMGLGNIAEVGTGDTNTLPTYGSKNGTTVYVDPNVVGKDVYLGYQYMVTRAVVRRYKDEVDLWQMENELNMAWFSCYGGERPFHLDPFGNAWGEFSFITNLLTTLRDAVKAEDPKALVTTNIEVDIAKWAYDATLSPDSYWEKAAKLWDPILDVIGIDSYPNMVVPAPCGANTTYNVIRKLRQIVGEEKKIIVLEAGMLVVHNSSNVPPAEGYTDAIQRECGMEFLTKSIEAGANGFIYFMNENSTGILPPPGGFTKDDIEALEHAGDDDPFDALGWILTHMHYMLNRFPIVLSSWFSGYGTMDETGKPRPIYYALKEFATGEA